MISGFEIINVEFDSKKEKWQPVWGEEREIENNYNEMLVLLNKIDEKTKMNIRFRLFNDSMGFRYEFPEQNGQNAKTKLTTNPNKSPTIP